MNLFTYRSMLAGYLFFALSSCTTVKVDTRIGLNDSAPSISVTDHTSPNYVWLDTVECKDKDVLKLKTYSIPAIPNVDLIPKGDQRAEINMLIDHITVLRKDLKQYVKDYGCF